LTYVVIVSVVSCEVTDMGMTEVYGVFLLRVDEFDSGLVRSPMARDLGFAMPSLPVTG